MDSSGLNHISLVQGLSETTSGKGLPKRQRIERQCLMLLTPLQR